MAEPVVYSRTRGQWLRGTVLAGFGALFGFAFLNIAGIAILNGAGGYLGAFIPIPRISPAVGLVGAFFMGFTVAGAWGYFTRPRLVTSGSSGASGDSPVAQYWPGYDPRLADRDPDQEVSAADE